MTSRTIDEIIIHCSATPNGRWHKAADIDRWHKDRGFRRDPKMAEHSLLKHIGYHYVISTRGGVESGRRHDEVGAHCKGHNFRSLGICLIGTDRYTPTQWTALTGLVAGLMRQFPDARVLGHRDASPDLNHDGKITSDEWIKRCPGFDVAAWLESGAPAAENILEGL